MGCVVLDSSLAIALVERIAIAGAGMLLHSHIAGCAAPEETAMSLKDYSFYPRRAHDPEAWRRRCYGRKRRVANPELRAKVLAVIAFASPRALYATEISSLTDCGLTGKQLHGILKTYEYRGYLAHRESSHSAAGHPSRSHLWFATDLLLRTPVAEIAPVFPVKQIEVEAAR